MAIFLKFIIYFFKEICDLLSMKLGNLIIKRFSDGEVNIKVIFFFFFKKKI